MIKYIDLHVHTTASDGTYSSKELIEYASEKHLSAVAITDHDCITGIKEAKKYGQIYDVEVISGIEFSTRYKNTEIHILGLYIDENSDIFLNGLDDIVNTRDERNYEIIKKLNKHGLDISMDDVINTADSCIYTRAHIAKALFQKGYVSSMREAFTKYIGNDCSCYVPREKVTPQLAIKLILECGGIPVLAHPTLYNMDLRQLDVLINELSQIGLMGIEGLYSLYTKSEEKYLKDFANKYNLIITGGSDFHGSNKPDIDLGVGRGNLKIPYEILEIIKSRKNKY
ncbi:phosphatase [Vallitalea longa]|uniref:Phosphatase n=1 Tax=Vallitalea longa TaxID=2936439 RepID=A0A9W5YEW9_9FIRM|nr:PHP domain-containing protein [Vallitalea longa]GKX31416.1 phosphatase [Vallitalea longa]